MHGPGDEDIQRYFIDTAFPTSQQVNAVIAALRDNPKTRNELQREVNARLSVLEKILTHLEVEKIIEKRNSAYVLLRPDAEPDYERWAAVTQLATLNFATCRPTPRTRLSDALHRRRTGRSRCAGTLRAL